jgi:hypothetical protein
LRGEKSLSANIYAFLALFVLSALLAIGLFFQLRDALQGLLQRTVRLPDGVTFYLRSFFILLFFSALAGALGFTFDLKPDSHLMEYVWKVASGLSNVLEQMLLYLAGYLVLTTVILATLKIKDDK